MTMEINLDLGLVDGQFDESRIELDAENRVSGVLVLSGVVDAEWIAAFDRSAPPDAPWKLEDTHTRRSDDTHTLSFGPIPVRELPAYLATLRNQIKAANQSVEGERHKRAMAEHLDAEERARAYQQAIQALSGVFGRRLSTVDDSQNQAA